MYNALSSHIQTNYGLQYFLTGQKMQKFINKTPKSFIQQQLFIK